MQTDNTSRDHKDIFTRHKRHRRAVTTPAGAPNQARSPVFPGGLVGADTGRARLLLRFPSSKEDEGGKRSRLMQPTLQVRQSLGRRLHHTLTSVPTTTPGPRVPQKSRTPGVASRARARIPAIRSAMYWPRHKDAHPAAWLGPLRPRSALLGFPPLSSSPTPYSPGEWEVPLSALSPRCGRREPTAKRSG